MKTVHMLKARDALVKLSSSETGQSKSAPRGQNALSDETSDKTKTLRYFLPFLSAPLLVLFAITVVSAFLAEEAAIGYISLSVFALFLYVWYTLYRNAVTGLEAKREALTPVVTVVREGERRLVSCEDLVCGDILLIKAGDRLYADCRVLQTAGLSVSQTVSGKKETVSKTAEVSEDVYENADNMLWTGSVVLRGDCRALVVAVGESRRALPPRSEGYTALLNGRYAKALKRLTSAATVALLGIVALVTVFGLTPLSAGGLWRDWLFAVSFAATTVLELSSLVLTVFLFRALSDVPSVYIRRYAAIEKLGAVDHAILPASALRDRLSIRAKAFLLPDPMGAVSEPISQAPREEAERLLKNAFLTLSVCQSEGVVTPLLQKAWVEPMSVLCDGCRLTFSESDETLAAYFLDLRALCRVFRRGDETFVSLVGDCRYLLEHAGFWYCGRAIKPLSERAGARFLRSPAIGVAIGALPKGAAHGESSLMKALSGKLVFEGAIALEEDDAAIASYISAFRESGISLTFLCDTVAECAYFQKNAAKHSVTLLHASSAKALSAHLEALRREGKAVLLDTTTLADADVASCADVTSFSGGFLTGELAASDAPALSDKGAAALREDAYCLYGDSAEGFAFLKRSLFDCFDGVTRATAYVLSTLGVKLLPTLFAIFLGKDLVSALFFVLMGFGFDTLAVCAILYQPRRETAQGRSLSLIERALSSLAAGILAGVAALVFSLVVSAYFSLSAEVFSTVTLLAVSLVSFWFSYYRPQTRPTPTPSLGTGLTVGGAITLFVLLLARGSFGKFGLLFLALTVAVFALSTLAARLVLKKFREKSLKKVKNRAKKCEKSLDK